MAALRKAEGPDGTCWRHGEASRLVARAARGERADLGRARKLLAEVRERRPGWERAPLLLARLAELEGRREEALGGYLRALELGAFAPGVVRRAASLLAAGGRVEAADRLTAIARARGTTGRDFLRTAAEIALRARNFEHAAELARLAVPADSGSASEQLWLGRVLAAGGRDTEAAAALRRAVRLAPDSPEAWLSLLAHLGRTGPAEQGDAALAEMKGKLPAGLRLLRP